MRSFAYLYIATVREFRRDVTALFWTMAFPVMFILIFGIIFSGENNINFDVGLVNEDGTASSQLVDGFEQIGAFKVTTGERDAELQALKDGDRSVVIIIPKGTGEAIGAYAAQFKTLDGTGTATLTSSDTRAAGDLPQASLQVYYDPANQTTSQVVLNIVDRVVSSMNEGVTGITPALTVTTESVSTNDLRSIDYLLPGVLAMSLMQLGLFGTAAPLVSLREKQVLRRMGATPLSKTTLLASQIAFRLTTAFLQTALIIVVGTLVFNVHIEMGNILAIAGIIMLGATMFITMGYFISGLAKTEEAVQGIISLPNFIFMFLSGIFFPVEMMPGWIRPLVDVIPLTYLGDALRKTMINAGSYFPMTRNIAILVAWLVVCGVLAVRFFRWEPQA
jgi:ABC-2 type transport system permease protein